MKKILATILASALGLGAWAVDPVTIKDADGADISVYEVSPGFYQGALKYTETTDFYITSKAGFKFFRDMVSACDGGVAITTYVQGGFYPGQSVPSIYTNNMFNNKTVHLLCDIDLENEDWTPIGYVNQGYNSSESKTYFYGSFDGHNHVISNLKVVADSNNQSNVQKAWKNYGSYGLFGYLSPNSSPTFRNLTIHNFEGVVGDTVTSDSGAGDYVGAIVGNAGTTPVTFDNCKVTGRIKINGSYSGAIYGIGNANVVNCEVSGDDGSTITGVYFAGGLVGAERAGSGTSLTISDNSVSGVAITSSQYVGGLVGAMATGAAGTCSITENSLSDVTVNDDAVTADSLIASNSDATAPVTEVDNTVSVSSQPVTNSVQSVNLFGAIKVTGVASNMFVAVPFEGFDGNAMPASNVVHAANLADDTKMYVWKGTEYSVYESASGKWTTPNKITVTEDGATVGTADLATAVAAGTGVILQRPGNSGNVYVYGQLPATTAGTVSFGAGQTLVSALSTNAMADVNLNAFTWTGVKATTKKRLKGQAGADYIQFRDKNNNLVKYYYLEGEGWGVVPTQVTQFSDLVSGGKALVPAGTAFWYYSSAGGAQLDWGE